MSEEPICCMIIVPSSPALLETIADREHAKRFPHGDHPHLWVSARSAGHGALFTREPGSEGTDWTIAEIASRELDDTPVFTVWFDDERAQVAVWRCGQQVEVLDRDPVELVRGLGFDLFPSERAPLWNRGGYHEVAIVEGASVDDVRAALGDAAAPCVVEQVRSGILVYRAGSDLADEPFTLSVGLPERRVYSVTHDDEAHEFMVRVMRDGVEVGRFNHPAVDPAHELPDVLGARSPRAILAALGVAPELLGYR